MADEQTFEILLGEFRRVGVDPDTFSAMLALRPEEALRALRALPDGAGATAFLAQLRQNGTLPSTPHAQEKLPGRAARPRDKSA